MRETESLTQATLCGRTATVGATTMACENHAGHPGDCWYNSVPPIGCVHCGAASSSHHGRGEYCTPLRGGPRVAGDGARFSARCTHPSFITRHAPGHWTANTSVAQQIRLPDVWVTTCNKCGAEIARAYSRPTVNLL